MQLKFTIMFLYVDNKLYGHIRSYIHLMYTGAFHFTIVTIKYPLKINVVHTIYSSTGNFISFKKILYCQKVPYMVILSEQ